MSYVLDALKKADAERRQGRIPALHDRHYEEVEFSVLPSRRRGKFLWLFGLLALLTLAAVSWQWLSVTRQPVEEMAGMADSDIPEADRQPETGWVVPGESARRNDNKNGRTETNSGGAETNTSPVVAVEERPVVKLADVSVDEVVIQPAPLQEPAMTTPRPVLPKPAIVDSSSLPLLAELPAVKRNVIPPISIEGHVYAQESSRRMVMINKQVLREGDMAGDGIKLLRITWDGVVLRHADAEFQVKIE